MNDRLLAYYEEELRHLREMGGEFAAAFPKIASRLGLDAFECADPYVERLLEGFSFLAARVRLQLDAQFPRFTQHLAEMMYPGLLAPTPSMAVVQFEPDPTHPAMAAGVSVPRGTALASRLDREGTTRCEYRTAHEVTLMPLRFDQAGYRAFDRFPPGVGGALDRSPKATLTLRFEWHANVPDTMRRLERLPLYLRGNDGLAEQLYLQLTGHVCGAYMRVGEQAPRYAPLPRARVSAKGFDDCEALLPTSSSTFRGCRLLREYFSFPERFLFVELAGLQASPFAAQASQFELVLLLDAYDSALEASVTATNFALHCTPAINLFGRRADRMAVDDRRFEHHVVVDRTRPLDFEVFAIEGIDGYSAGQSAPQRFAPFYRARDPGACDRAYFQMRRTPRLLTERERVRGARSGYAGTEIYVALVDPANAPYSGELRQLSVDALCTNRDLPLSMPVGAGVTDFTAGAELAAIEGVRCVSGPSAPRPPLTDERGLWRLLDMLSTSRLPLLVRTAASPGDGPASDDARALRQWLGAMCPEGDEAAQRQIAQLRAASARPVTRRLPLAGPVSFGRGLEIALTFDDAAWAGSRASLLGAVLAQALADYMPINQFAETCIRSPRRGVLARYPARAGRCEIL
ncbi:MAG TPA: type VI secretion system baseplate subunit TssF [Trinickia sp.]